jgi:hypothetical protein
MLGSWKIGAQLSTSHSSRIALDPSDMLETVHRAREAIGLDLLIVGFREVPEAFLEFCGKSRPIDQVHLWYSALSDIEEMEDSDLVVNWRGEPSVGIFVPAIAPPSRPDFSSARALPTLA